MSLLRRSRVDFLAHGSTPWQGWLLLSLGVSACLAVGAWRTQWLRESAEQALAVREQQAAASRERERAQRRAMPTPGDLRLAKARQQLNWPWLEALRIIESATEAPVFLLGMTADAGQAEVRLEAEANSFAQAVAYVQRLGGPGGFSEVRLQAHELLPDTISGGNKLRFTVVAAWTPR